MVSGATATARNRTNVIIKALLWFLQRCPASTGGCLTRGRMKGLKPSVNLCGDFLEFLARVNKKGPAGAGLAQNDCSAALHDGGPTLKPSAVLSRLLAADGPKLTLKLPQKDRSFRKILLT